MIEERIVTQYRVYCGRCNRALTRWMVDLSTAREVYRVHVTWHIEQDRA